jgi:ferredoxin
VVLILAGCNDSSVVKTKTDQKENDSVIDNYSNQNQVLESTVDDNLKNEDQLSEDQVDKLKQLVVDGKKCIGCGKCVRIAQANFAMQDNKSVVISQSEIDSDGVIKAMNNCPVEAIDIIS